MSVLHDYYCPECDRIDFDHWDPPTCCGGLMRIAFRTLHTTEWGSPRRFIHIRDEPFNSRSELEAYAKQNHMALGASAEKVGGARNEDHLNLGKKFSYSGSPKS